MYIFILLYSYHICICVCFPNINDDDDDDDLHSAALLLQRFRAIVGLLFASAGGDALLRHDAQELVLLGAVVVLGADVDELLELPAIGHGRYHLGDFVLLALEHTVDALFVENGALNKILNGRKEVGMRTRLALFAYFVICRSLIIYMLEWIGIVNVDCDCENFKCDVETQFNCAAHTQIKFVSHKKTIERSMFSSD